MGKSWEPIPSPQEHRPHYGGHSYMGRVMAALRLPFPEAIIAIHDLYPWRDSGIASFVDAAQCDLADGKTGEVERRVFAFIRDALASKPKLPPKPSRVWWRRFILWLTP